MDIEELAGIEPESAQTEHTVYELFKWSLLLKGAISVAEVIAGLVLLVIPAKYVIALVQSSGVWLAGYADNSITTHITSELLRFESGTALFVAFYLLTRGLIKCGLIAALLKNILWAYPASLVVLGLFVVYQAYEIIAKGSIFVIAISVFDLIVMYLIWREWKIVKRHQTIH